ncbi:MAG: hypothetical protein KAT71_01980, partial [Gammaproteobacteria bacterium]|nr:hypothetical protein [Gammaproteobacteria bacterium]
EIAEINSATTRMSEAALQAHAQKFAASYAHMTDTLDASGHGLKMVNIFPILLTLANVYGGGLDDNGTIANDGDWSAYLIISFASFLVFFCQGYNSNRSESEQLLREFFAAVDSKVPDVGQGQGSLNADSESAPGGYATMWHRIYRDGNKDPHAVLNELMEKLQPDREERTPLLL